MAVMVGASGLLLLTAGPALARIPEPMPGGSMGCCPGFYTLAVPGTLAGGAQVQTTLEHPLDIGLVVSDYANLPGPVGLVPLGHLDPGTHTLAWDLRVGGQLLGPGRYLVAEESFGADGHPAGRLFPPPALLTVSTDGRTTVVMTSLASTSKTKWAIVAIGVIVALVVGVLVGVAVGRRRSAIP